MDNLFVISHGNLNGKDYFIVKSNHFKRNDLWFIKADDGTTYGGYVKEIIGSFAILIHLEDDDIIVPTAA